MCGEVRTNKKLDSKRALSLFLMLFVFISSFADVGNWRRYHDEGLSSFNKGDYKAAEAKFKQAIGIAEDDLSRSKYHAKSLFRLGITLHKLGKSNKGISLMEKAHKYMRKKLGKRDKETLILLTGIADIRLQSGRPQYAEKIYRTVLKYRIKELGENHNLVAATRESLARTLGQLDKNEEAVELFELAIKITKKNGGNEAFLAGQYEEYAKLLKRIGEHKKAEKFSNKAMEMRSTSKAQSAINAPTDHGFKLSKTAGEYKEPPGFLNFKTTMINKGYNFSEEYMHRLCKNKKFFTLVHHCIVYWFKSSQRARGGVYPLATLKIIQYGDQSSAEEAFNNLKKSANPNTGVNYEWDYIVNHGNHMYWLNASCSFSKTKWAGMLTELKTAMSISDDSQMPKMNCKCGGGCK